MKKIRIIIIYCIITFISFLNVGKSNDFRVNYKNGTEIICQPQDQTLLVRTSYDIFKVPFSQIDSMEFNADHNDIAMKLKNGDKFSVKIITYSFKADTANGEINILTENLKSIDRVSIGASVPVANTSPAKSIKFCGFVWMPWRRAFEIKNSRLMTLPSSRKGFLYGHTGHGRDATLVTNVGNKKWKNYCVQFNFGMLPVDPSYNPLALPSDFKRVGLLFHIADMKESWNEKGFSGYRLILEPNGDWVLYCYNNQYCQIPMGWGNEIADKSRIVTTGSGLKLNFDKGNKVKIEIVGDKIKVIINDQKCIDVIDPEMNQEFGGVKTDHGGVGIQWVWETTGWISHFTYKPL